MSTIGVGAARHRARNTDYDAAQALLDLQSNNKPEGNTDAGPYPGNWRERDNKEDIEKAAKLILSCFISSDAPAKNNNHGTNTQFPIKPKRLMNTSRNYRSRCEPEIKTRNEALKTSPRSHPKNLNQHYFSNRHAPFNIGTNPKLSSKAERKSNTRDVGTQTEEQYCNPNIMLMETTIKNLCDRIKSLEAQIKTTLGQSADEASFETAGHNLDLTYENDPDFEMTINDTDTANESKYSRTSEFDSSTHNDSRSRQTNKNVVYNEVLTNHNTNSLDLVPIGDGNATVSSRLLKHINWNSYSSATRKLLTAVFSRRILATHSLTGKPSPAFPNKPAKKRLDPALVNDIVQTVVERCHVPENVVRTSITTKCADESKMFRTRENNKKKRFNKKNRENVPPSTDSESDNY